MHTIEAQTDPNTIVYFGTKKVVNYPTLLARHSSDSFLEGGASCVNDGTCRNHVSRRARV